MPDFSVFMCSFPDCGRKSTGMIELKGEFYPFCREHGEKANIYLKKEEENEKNV